MRFGRARQRTDIAGDLKVEIGAEQAKRYTKYT
jgi:hypothetical protein